MIQAVLNHLWQSTLLVAVIGLLTWLLRNYRASVRYSLWFAASLKFLLPFSLLVTLGTHLSWHSPRAIAVAPILSQVVEPFPAHLTPAPGEFNASPGPARKPTPAPQSRLDLTAILRGLWACGTSLILALWIVRWLRIRRVVRHAVPLAIAAPIPVRAAQTTAPQTNIEPGVVGVARPVLLLPHGIAQSIEPQQLRAIVAHEVEHVRRHDNLTAAIFMLIQALFWFYPLVWWLGTRLHVERERACDEAVIAAGCQRETYAQSILNVCRLYLQLPLPCVAGIAGGELQKRIESIMVPRPVHALSAAAGVLLGLTATSAVLAPIALGAVSATTASAQVQTPAETPDGSQLALSRELLRQERYAELDQTMNGLQQAYKSGTLDELALLHAFTAFGLADPAFESHFNAWIDTYPGSYAARLARGIYYFRSGVQTRGTRFAVHTTKEQTRGMKLYLDKAREDLQASLVLDSKPMLSYNYLIRVGMALGGRESNRQLLDAALKLDRVALIARRPYLYSLQTRWGGSLNEMLDFMQESRNEGLTDSQLSVLQKVVDDEREWLRHWQGGSAQTNVDPG